MTLSYAAEHPHSLSTYIDFIFRNKTLFCVLVKMIPKIKAFNFLLKIQQQ